MRAGKTLPFLTLGIASIVGCNVIAGLNKNYQVGTGGGAPSSTSTGSGAPNGTACTAGATCSSGFCVDDVCCDKACSGTCEACTAALTGGKDGVCGNVIAGLAAPTGQCSADGGTCGNTGKCAAGGTCQQAAQGVDCGTTCTNAAQSNNQCDGNGKCATGALVQCSNALECNAAGTECLASCSKDSDCKEGYYCNAADGGTGACETQAGLGLPCTSPDQCPSKFCVDNVCCSSACGGTCSSCVVPGHVGVCSTEADNDNNPDHPCSTGSACCAGACTDLSDVDTCGACGTKCTTPTACLVPTCSGTTPTCGSTPATMGTACSDHGGSVCDGSGNCVPCNKANDCSGLKEPACCNNQCIDLSSDVNNCNACGMQCTTGTTPACCNSVCVDLTQTANCGTCGNTCQGADICYNNACAPPFWALVGSVSGYNLGYWGKAAGFATNTSRLIYLQAEDTTSYTFDTNSTVFTTQPENSDICGCGYTGELIPVGASLYYIANDAQVFTMSGNTGSWSMLSSYPTARGEAAYGTDGTAIYITGGRTGDSSDKLVVAGTVWSTIANAPAQVQQGVGGMVNGLFYAWGGENTTHMYAYKPSANTWTQVMPDPPYQFNNAYAPAWRGKLVVTGQSGPIAVFDPAGPTWSTIIPPPGFTFGMPLSAVTIPGSPDDLYLVADTANGVNIYHYLQ